MPNCGLRIADCRLMAGDTDTISGMSKARFANCSEDEKSCTDDHCCVVSHGNSLNGWRMPDSLGRYGQR
jgi:hypothetical protein